MRYKTGMYGGSFDPMHQGHLETMIHAASVCEKLYIVLSYCRVRDRIPMEYRYRWIKQSMSHLSHVTVLLLEDHARTKQEYGEEDWQEGAKKIKNMIGEPIQVVFCGTDYRGTNRYEKLYPEAKILYIERSNVPVSSSEIHANPFRYWEYLPELVRPWYVKKILLVGGESTGKSTLTQNLALTFHTAFVEEAGRDICAEAGGEETMLAEDLYKCVLYQKTAIWEKTKQANRFLFIDTDALTTRFYMDFLLQDTEQKQKALFLADAVDAINDFDLIFFLEPDVDFVQDGTRNEQIKQERKKYSEMLKKCLRQSGREYVSLSGDYEERYEKAVKMIRELWSWEN